uniref:Uncharacterized protein n=1 Tax=Mustela putorius furo TaxID=9669 RepID=M3YXM3_MUSPF
MPPRSPPAWSGGAPVLTARMGRGPRSLPEVKLVGLTRNPNPSDRLSRQSSHGSRHGNKLLAPEVSGMQPGLACPPTLWLPGAVCQAPGAGPLQDRATASALSSLGTRAACCSGPRGVGPAAYWSLGGGGRGPLRGGHAEALSRSPLPLHSSFSPLPLPRAPTSCTPPDLRGSPALPSRGAGSFRSHARGPLSHLLWGPGGHGLAVHGLLPVQVQLGGGGRRGGKLLWAKLKKLSYVSVLYSDPSSFGRRP